MQMESMSKNVVNIMMELAKNEGLAMLLINNDKNPFITPVNKTNIINISSPECKIFPYPFDVGATDVDGSFIRVYYNDGEFDNEVIAESQLHIDIIVAKSIWTINDGKPKIRPYEIMGRVKDMVGKRSLNSTIKIDFKGYQHLYVNPKFDCIRMYAEYMSIET